MKKILLFSLILITSIKLNAQNATLAKSYYEKALQNLNSNDYNKALEYIEKSKEYAGSTNPDIMYVELKTRYKIDLNINKTKALINNFLNDSFDDDERRKEVADLLININESRAYHPTGYKKRITLKEHPKNGKSYIIINEKGKQTGASIYNGEYIVETIDNVYVLYKAKNFQVSYTGQGYNDDGYKTKDNYKSEIIEVYKEGADIKRTLPYFFEEKQKSFYSSKLDYRIICHKGFYEDYKYGYVSKKEKVFFYIDTQIIDQNIGYHVNNKYQTFEIDYRQPKIEWNNDIEKDFIKISKYGVNESFYGLDKNHYETKWSISSLDYIKLSNIIDNSIYSYLKNKGVVTNIFGEMEKGVIPKTVMLECVKRCGKDRKLVIEFDNLGIPEKYTVTTKKGVSRSTTFNKTNMSWD